MNKAVTACMAGGGGGSSIVGGLVPRFPNVSAKHGLHLEPWAFGEFCIKRRVHRLSDIQGLVFPLCPSVWFARAAFPSTMAPRPGLPVAFSLGLRERQD